MVGGGGGGDKGGGGLDSIAMHITGLPDALNSIDIQTGKKN